jgi:hypothetical protein
LHPVCDVSDANSYWWRGSLMRTAGCIALSSLVACATLGQKSTQPDLSPWPEIRSDFRVEALRQRMHEYSITFAAEVDLAATAIEQRAADPLIRRNALLWKLRAIPEMRKACFRLEPVSALIDAWILARQMERLMTDGVGAFGSYQPEAVAVAGRMVEQMRAIGGSIAVSPQTSATFEGNVIEPWVDEHPLRDLTFVRESPIARFAEQSRARGDTLQAVGTIEDVVLSLSQQARIYLADLPRQVRGELDLVRSDIVPADAAAGMQRDLHASAAAVDRIASTVEAIPPLTLNERRIILDEISRQRALVMDAVSVERERAVGGTTAAFAVERAELLRSIEAQRLATLEWLTVERHETIADVHRELAAAVEALRGERAIVVTELRGVVDLVLARIAIFLVAAAVLAPIVAHAYVRVWPRRRS